MTTVNYSKLPPRDERVRRGVNKTKGKINGGAMIPRFLFCAVKRRGVTLPSLLSSRLYIYIYREIFFLTQL